MIHHVSVGTNDADRARSFYDPVMEVLGIRCLHVRDGSIDYGTGVVLFSVERPSDGKAASAGNGTHIAFAADFRKQIDEFYKVGLANGGTDGGPPGVRPEYDENYYGAFLLDPDGNKIEAVTFSAK